MREEKPRRAKRLSLLSSHSATAHTCSRARSRDCVCARIRGCCGGLGAPTLGAGNPRLTALACRAIATERALDIHRVGAGVFSLVLAHVRHCVLLSNCQRDFNGPLQDSEDTYRYQKLSSIRGAL